MKIDVDFVKKHNARLKRELERNYDRDTAQDLLADVFLRAIEKQHTYDPKKGSEAVWLRVIMNNIISEFEEKRGSSMDAMHRVEFSLDEARGGGEGLSGHDIYSEEDDKLWNSHRWVVENLDYVKDYVDRLSPRLGVVFNLRMIRGHTWDEIGMIMNCSGENARLMCRKAIQEIESIIEGENQ